MNTLLLHRLINEEGFRPTIYNDQFGNPTFMYGWAINKRPPTPELGQLVLEYQITEVEKDVLKLYAIWYVRLSQIRQSVILDMVYQIGISGFGLFKEMIAKIIAGDFNGAAEEMINSRWAEQTPERVSALADLFRKG